MKTSDIPAPVLSDVFKIIAQMHNTSAAKLPKESIPEEEFMAALAYNLSTPLFEENDITNEAVESCRQCSRELDPAGMAEYRFVPMIIKGQTLLAVSSCPWDPMMVEVCLGYFPQCTVVRFTLASPQTLNSLLGRLKNEPVTNIGGYSSAKPIAPPKPLTPPTAAPIAPPKPFDAPTPVIAPPVSAPVIAQPAAGLPTMPVPKTPVAQVPAAGVIETQPHTIPIAIEGLTQEDINYLVSLLVTEGNKLLARRRKQK